MMPATTPGGQIPKERPLTRSVGVAVLVGLAVGLAALAIGVAIIAIPLFALARFAEPGRGLERPVIRDNLIHFALPAGAIAGTIVGGIVGRWYRRGGTLPSPND
jgi:hypothetical protein